MLSEKTKKIYAIVIVAFSILFTSFSFYFYQIIKAPNILAEGRETLIKIPKDATFKMVQDSIIKYKITGNLVAFSFLAKLMDYDDQIKPGVYLLKPNMTNYQAVVMLRSGAQVPIDLTFNNVRLKEDLAEKVSKQLMMEEGEFLKLLNSKEFLAKHQLTPDNVMSIFIPNTYEVYWTISPEALFERMFEEHNRFWNEDRIKKAEAIGLSPLEVSILASIVQAESVKYDESPKIAGVYLNRLKKNMPLQADPTLVFAAGDFTIKRVLNKHKELDSPYNTYKYTGLPPGLINLPDMRSIDAVLNYGQHKYLYFCAKEDFSGYHTFATNLIDHLNNASKYQAALDKAKLYK